MLLCQQSDGEMIPGSDSPLLREADEILNTRSGIFMQSRAEGLSEGIRGCLMAGNS